VRIKQHIAIHLTLVKISIQIPCKITYTADIRHHFAAYALLSLPLLLHSARPHTAAAFRIFALNTPQPRMPQRKSAWPKRQATCCARSGAHDRTVLRILQRLPTTVCSVTPNPSLQTRFDRSRENERLRDRKEKAVV
jgi:hypothetical protein